MEQVNCRLLIVEDDTALAALLEEYLSEANYTVRVCHDGKTALDSLNHEPFDLVLSDIILPDISGLSVLQKARGEPAHTLVILMTGYSSIDDVLHAIEQGAYDFVNKPFQLPEIRIRLDNAARYQRLLRQLKDKKGENHFSRPARISENAAVRVYDAQTVK